MIGRIPMIGNDSSVRKYNITKHGSERFLRLFAEFNNPYEIDWEVSCDEGESIS